MFETSFLLLIKNLIYNIILPLVPGIVFLWIFFGKRFHGMLLYLLWWFIGVGVIAFSLFNLQFIYFWIGISAYLLILWLLILIFIGKILYQKLVFQEYFSTLKIKNLFPQIKWSFLHLSQVEQIFTVVCGALGILFLILVFIRVTNFPSYADDSFGNRNGPAYNIYQDWGVQMFWDKTEILGRGRLWYPIMIPLYKATVSQFLWWFNDIYINMRQFLLFLGGIMFIFLITFNKTKNIFYSLLPIGLIVSLPLVFFHAGEGYMELPCAVYSILTIRAFWKFLEDKDYNYISLALLLGFMLSHIKNDGLLWYFAGIIITFVWILLFSKQFIPVLVTFIKKRTILRSSLFYLFFFFVPFLIIKWYYHLGFNQSVGNTWFGVSSSSIHPEIFQLFKPIFFGMDNYNVVLIVVILMWTFRYVYKKHDHKTLLLFLAPVVIFIIFVLVFLLTENYIFAMNQTTISRVFTMAFVLLCAFTWLFFYREWKD